MIYVLLDLMLSYFNSIKVRLKLTNYALYYSKTAFQFHKGTIKTLLEC